MSRAGDAWRRYRLPRQVHPVAWWLWALALCAAASWTTNPLVLGLQLVVVALVVASRRDDSPWAGSFRLYALLGLFVVVVRVLYRVLLGGGDGTTVLLRLPGIPLPAVSAGLRLLGPVTLEAVLAGLYDGLRLSAIIVTIGAANALANPRTLLASLPGALYEIGTVLVVAVAVFPQLGASLTRVRRARALRPARVSGSRWTGRLHVVRGIIVPVLTDALDSAVSLAASMDARGFGRTGSASRTQRGAVTALVLTALVLLGVGAYGLLAAVSPRLFGWPALVLAGLATVAAFWLSGRQVRRTRYRSHPWGVAEVLVVGAGVAGAAGVLLVSRGPDAGLLVPQLLPVIEWPALPYAVLAGLLVALLPAVVTPPPRLAAEGGVA